MILEFDATVDVAGTTAKTPDDPHQHRKLTLAGPDRAPKTKTAAVTTTVVEPWVDQKTHAGGKTVKPGEVRAADGHGLEPERVPRLDGQRLDRRRHRARRADPVQRRAPVADGGSRSTGGGIWNETRGRSPGRSPNWLRAPRPAPLRTCRCDPPTPARSSDNTVSKTTSMPGTVTGERTAASTSHAGYEAEAEDEATLNDAGLKSRWWRRMGRRSARR